MDENNQQTISESNGQSPMSAVYGSHEGAPKTTQKPANNNPSFFKKSTSFVWELVKILVIAAIIVLPIRYFLFQPFIVKGDSMVPNFHTGDYLIVDEISYRLVPVNRGDVVVLKYPLDTTQRFIKRIIGLPGETVDIHSDKITITKDGKAVTLNESYIPASFQTDGDIHITLNTDDYFVLGDNRDNSQDSRLFGPIAQSKITGQARYLYWARNASRIGKKLE